MAKSVKQRDLNLKLWRACRDGQADVAEQCLKDGADATYINPDETENEDDDHPIHWAARNNLVNIVQLLLEGGASTEATNIKLGFTPLHDSAQFGTTEVAEVLLRHKANTEARTNEVGFTPLHASAQFGTTEVAEVLLRHKANTEALSNEVGFTPLHVSAQVGTTEVAEVLLRHKANTEALTNAGNTPLHISAQTGTTGVAEVLLRYKANTEAKNEDVGFTPLHMSAQFGTTEVAEVLLRHKANTEALSNDGRTPLDISAWKGTTGVAEVLLRYKANTEAKKEELGFTPLHVSAQFGTTEVAEVLLRHKANTQALTNELGFTPLHISAQHGTTEVAEVLLRHKANTEALTNDDSTPLHIAAFHNKAYVARLLLTCPTFTMRDAKDEDGYTAMDLAKQQKSTHIIDLLEQVEVSGLPSHETQLRRKELEHQKTLDEKEEDFKTLRTQMEVLKEQLQTFALDRERYHAQLAVYNFPKTKLGRVIILANSEFTYLDGRPGTDVDVANLTRTFEKIGYKVVPHRNSTAEEMKGILEDLSSSKVQASYGCTVVVILSHGTEEGVAGTDGKFMSDDVFFQTLGESKQLKGKPKIVLIQACRGAKADDDPAEKGADGGYGEYVPDTESYKESKPSSPGLDLIIVKSAIPKTLAMRSPTRGSLFIEALTDVVKMNSHRLEFEGMLKLVAENMDRRGQRLGFQACPSVCHGALTKRLFLVPRD